MKPYYDHAGITIYHGDSREVLDNIGCGWFVLTDPPYSSGRSESEFAATGNIAVCLDMASRLCESMAVFGTSSGRGIEFIRSSIRRLNHCRVLVWNRTYVNSPAAGPWRWDVILIHIFGKGAFGRPQQSSLIQTNGTQKLAKETGHRSPVPVEVMEWIARPFNTGILDPFMGSGSSLIAARRLGQDAIGIDIEERYCEIAAKRLSQEVLPLEEGDRE